MAGCGRDGRWTKRGPPRLEQMLFSLPRLPLCFEGPFLVDTVWSLPKEACLIPARTAPSSPLFGVLARGTWLLPKLYFLHFCSGSFLSNRCCASPRWFPFSLIAAAFAQPEFLGRRTRSGILACALCCSALRKLHLSPYSYCVLRIVFSRMCMGAFHQPLYLFVARCFGGCILGARNSFRLQRRIT